MTTKATPPNMKLSWSIHWHHCFGLNLSLWSSCFTFGCNLIIGAIFEKYKVGSFIELNMNLTYISNYETYIYGVYVLAKMYHHCSSKELSSDLAHCSTEQICYVTCNWPADLKSVCREIYFQLCTVKFFSAMLKKYFVCGFILQRWVRA